MKNSACLKPNIQLRLLGESFQRHCNCLWHIVQLTSIKRIRFSVLVNSSSAVHEVGVNLQVLGSFTQNAKMPAMTWKSIHWLPSLLQGEVAWATVGEIGVTLRIIISLRTWRPAFNGFDRSLESVISTLNYIHASRVCMAFHQTSSLLQSTQGPQWSQE